MFSSVQMYIKFYENSKIRIILGNFNPKIKAIFEMENIRKKTYEYILLF